MEAMFLVSRTGLDVRFSNISSNIPAGSTYLWDFGDNSETSDIKSPTHTYTNSDFYEVVLTITPPIQDPPLEPLTCSQTVAISEDSQTSLNGSIYNLINHYIPSNIIKTFPFSQKQLYITKWQLYIQPLVNHDIPISEYNNELYYEALENQLIMECAVYDFLVNTFTNMIQSISSSHSKVDEENNNTDTTSVTSNGNVKKIVTGPSEVEFFDSTTTDSDIVTSTVKAVESGGILDVIKQNLCLLAERLEIFLPICSRQYHLIIPESVKQYSSKRPLRGPNPVLPIT